MNHQMTMRRTKFALFVFLLFVFGQQVKVEDWVECTECKRWAHVEYTGPGKCPTYICHNCRVHRM